MSLPDGSAAEIIWSIEDSGDFSMLVAAPEGTTRDPIESPDKRARPNWSRPDHEWATSINPDVDGRWTLEAKLRNPAAGSPVPRVRCCRGALTAVGRISCPQDCGALEADGAGNSQVPVVVRLPRSGFGLRIRLWTVNPEL
jgi:hypothetical protein